MVRNITVDSSEFKALNFGSGAAAIWGSSGMTGAAATVVTSSITVRNVLVEGNFVGAVFGYRGGGVSDITVRDVKIIGADAYSRAGGVAGTAGDSSIAYSER